MGPEAIRLTKFYQALDQVLQPGEEYPFSVDFKDLNLLNSTIEDACALVNAKYDAALALLSKMNTPTVQTFDYCSFCNGSLHVAGIMIANKKSDAKICASCAKGASAAIDCMSDDIFS